MSGNGIVSSARTYIAVVPDPIVVIAPNAASSGPVNVQAKTPGHYKNTLRKTDEKFVIDNMTQYGSWMRLI